MNYRALILAASLFAAHSAYAATKTYGVSIGAGHTDNITRAPANEQSESMASAGLDFSIAEETTRLSTQAAADFSYVEYLDDTYDSEVIGNLNALAVFAFVPERFEWVAQDNFGQTRLDPFQAVTPDNRENINYLTTGPDFTLRFGSVTRGRLSGRYSKVTYEDSPFDSNRFGGTLSLLRDLSSATVLSANVQTEKAEYDEASLAASDYDRSAAFLGYKANLNRTRANLELGYTVLSRDNAVEDSKGLLARIELQRQLSERSMLALRLGREFSDAGSSFRMQQDLGAVNLDTQAVLQTSDPFVSEYAGLEWSLDGLRTGFSAGARTFRESYEQQVNLDRRRTLANAQVYRNLTPSLRLQVGGIVTKEKFENLVNNDFRETTGFASLSWRTGRRIGVTLQYNRYQRSADVASTEFNENRVWLQIRYGEGSPGAALPSRSRVSSAPSDSTGG